VTGPSQRSRRNDNRVDYSTLSGKKAAAVPSNDELNVNLEKAKQVVQEKGVLHQEALKKMDAFEQDHCVMPIS